jgi:hypothetical protein
MSPQEILGLACVTVVMTTSKIFRPLQRVYPPLFGCGLCLGLWVGIGGAVYGRVFGLAAIEVGAIVGCLAAFLQFALRIMEAMVPPEHVKRSKTLGQWMDEHEARIQSLQDDATSAR